MLSKSRASRISVFGSPGSGKSTFGRRLAHSLDLPLLALDDLYWGPNWERPNKQDWLHTLRMQLAAEAFVVEGGYVETIDMRIERAELVYLVEAPAWLCEWRFVARVMRIAGGDMSLLPKRVPLDLRPTPTARGDFTRMLAKIAKYRQEVRPLILSAAKRHGVPLVVVDSGISAQSGRLAAPSPF